MCARGVGWDRWSPIHLFTNKKKCTSCFLSLKMIKTNLLFSKTKDYIDITSSFWNHMFLDITFFELLFLNEFTDLEEKNTLG